MALFEFLKRIRVDCASYNKQKTPGDIIQGVPSLNAIINKFNTTVFLSKVKIYKNNCDIVNVG